MGIIIGAAFTAIATSLVEDLFNPLLGLLIGEADFFNVFVVLSGERRASLKATREGGTVVLAVGRFVNADIKFLIVAFAVFWLVRVFACFKQQEEARPTAPPAPTSTEKLLAEIRDELRAGCGAPATPDAVSRGGAPR